MLRSVTSNEPSAWSGICTRRPSAVTTTATGRRSRPLLRPTVALSVALPPRGRGAVRSGQSSMPSRSRNHPHYPGPSAICDVASGVGGRVGTGFRQAGAWPRPHRYRAGGPERGPAPNERTAEVRRSVQQHSCGATPRSLPAVARLEDKGRAGQSGKRTHDAERLKPDEGLHGQFHQRMPAPSVRAIDATSARTQVKRARFDFTGVTPDWRQFTLGPATGRSSIGRSLALRPRLATGLPWTDLEWGTFVLDTDRTDVPVRVPSPGSTSPPVSGPMCTQATTGPREGSREPRLSSQPAAPGSVQSMGPRPAGASPPRS